MRLTFGDLAQVEESPAEPSLVLSGPLEITSITRESSLVANIRQRHNGALIVGTRALVVDSHESIALEIGNGTKGSVNWELVVIDTKTVAVCVRVRKKSGL